MGSSVVDIESAPPLESNCLLTTSTRCLQSFFAKLITRLGMISVIAACLLWLKPAHAPQLLLYPALAFQLPSLEPRTSSHRSIDPKSEPHPIELICSQFEPNSTCTSIQEELFLSLTLPHVINPVSPPLHRMTQGDTPPSTSSSDSDQNRTPLSSTEVRRALFSPEPSPLTMTDPVIHNEDEIAVKTVVEPEDPLADPQNQPPAQQAVPPGATANTTSSTTGTSTVPAVAAPPPVVAPPLLAAPPPA